MTLDPERAEGDAPTGLGSGTEAGPATPSAPTLDQDIEAVWDLVDDSPDMAALRAALDRIYTDLRELINAIALAHRDGGLRVVTTQGGEAMLLAHDDEVRNERRDSGRLLRRPSEPKESP